MNLNKVVLKFVSISFSILVILLVILGLVKLGTFCYEFGYRVFTEAPVEEEPGTNIEVEVSEGMSEHDIGKLSDEMFFCTAHITETQKGCLIPLRKSCNQRIFQNSLQYCQ